MPDELLTKVKGQVDDVEKTLAQGKEYIRLLKEMGEDTTAQETKFRELEKKTTKFKQALKNRGY